jgi:TRAP-type mannitol/chloroaromatic compound transport system substrate-binding protein
MWRAENAATALLKKATNGRLDIQLFPGTALVGYEQMFDAVKDGTYEVNWGSASAFYEGKDPGFAILWNLPGIWESTFDATTWIEHFGGRALFEKAFGAYGIQYIGPEITGGEPLMSKKPIRTIGDIKGMKIRGAPGLEQGIWTTFGASCVDLPGTEIYTALQTGLIDAAAYITIGDDYGIGLHEVAKYIIYPSVHCPTANCDISVNQKAWDSLPPDLQAAFYSVARWSCNEVIYSSVKDDFEALAKMQAAGVEHIRLSPEDMALAREKAMAMADDWAKKSPLANEVVQSVYSFLRTIGKMK